jgi:hypothetical protein
MTKTICVASADTETSNTFHFSAWTRSLSARSRLWRLLAIAAIVCSLACPESGDSGSGDEEGRIFFSIDPPAVYLSPGDSFAMPLTARDRADRRTPSFRLASPLVRPNLSRVEIDRPFDGVTFLSVETSPATDPGVYPVSIIATIDPGFESSSSVTQTLKVVVLPSEFAGQSEAIVEVAAGLAHSLALDANGDIWAWGRNGHGQLGDGSLVDRAIAVRVADLPRPAVAIAAGKRHSLALLDDGTVASWGDNSQGQVQPTAAANRFEGDLRELPEIVTTPGDSEALSGFIAVAAGAEHSLALRSDGDVTA